MNYEYYLSISFPNSINVYAKQLVKQISISVSVSLNPIQNVPCSQTVIAFQVWKFNMPTI